MFLKKILTAYVIVAFMLTGCAAPTRTPSTVGPRTSSAYEEQPMFEQELFTPKLDVIIPVFDPGLPENPADLKDDSIWPELRRAEANRFAYKLKEHLERSGEFGAIRVTPDETATGDLYILGRIEESTGEDVEIEIIVLDIAGKVWLTDSFDHEVS